MSYIEFINVEKYFGKQKVLKNLNLSIEKGELVTLLGSSGCGKSTLLRLLAGLENVSGGNLSIDGEDVTHKSPRERNVGMIFQQYSLFPTMNVYHNISFGLRMKRMDQNLVSSAVSEAIRMVNLEGSEKKYPSQLSGGEQQRVAIARALVNEPSMLLADEPTGNLDNNNAWEIMKLLEEINEKGTTVIVVTHNLEIVKVMKKRVITIKKGLVVSDSKDGDSDEY